MLDIILHNPFRLIGVFSTTTRKEIVANLARIKANIRVNRQISFPADLDGILPPPKRTAETIADAESKFNPATLPERPLSQLLVVVFVSASLSTLVTA